MDREVPEINERVFSYFKDHAQAFDYQDQYGWPDLSYEGEKRSLIVHDAARFKILEQLVEPTGLEFDNVVAECIDLYRATCWKIPDDFLELSHFRRVVNRLRMQSSPGIPFCRKYATIGDYLGYNVETLRCNSLRLEVLWAEVQERLKGSPPAPIRVFVKYEPHKRQKLEDGKLRLISSINIVDQIIDHMLFDEQNDLEVASFSQIPSKAGWTPSGGGWKLLYGTVGSDTLSIDKSSWDWGMPYWVIMADYKVRENLCLNINPVWKALALRRYQELYRDCELMLSNGEIYKQIVPGLQKSGAVNTISSNSRCQVLLHLLAKNRLGQDVPAPIVIGDDTTQPYFPYDAYIVHLQSGGCRVKEAKRGPCEFAGHVINRDGAFPMYRAKHYFNLIHVKEEILKSLLESYQRLYAKDDIRLGIIQGFIVAHEPSCWLSPFYLRRWYDGFVT